jgi:very-short-patch-repair endonuclease
MDVLDALDRLDGVASTRELRELGFSPRAVQRLAATESILRVRPGVYADPRADPRIVAAARVGGRAAGATAAAIHGLWTPPHAALTVHVGRAAVLRDPRDAGRPLTSASPPVSVLWSRRNPARRLGVSPIEEVPGQVLRSEPLPVAIAILDSMVRRTPFSQNDLWALTEDLPLTLRGRLAFVDPRCESGTESVVRVRLHQAGFTVVPQFALPYTDLDRADLLVENRIIVECDSSFHDDPRVRDRDAERDLALTALGYVVLRVRYRTAMFDLDAVVAAVQTLVGRLDLRESVAI